MKSIFDFKTSNKDLEGSNQGLSNYRYQEVQSLRSVTGTNFPDGEIVYRWGSGGNKYWIPAKSYLKVRLQLRDENGLPIQQLDNLIYSMNTVPQMFQSMSFKIADQTVCALTQNLSQVDTMKNRMTKSAGWLNSIGHSRNYWHHSYAERERKMLTAGGNHINGGLNPYKGFSEIVQEAKIDNDDEFTISLVSAASNQYLLTFSDTNNADLDLTLISGFTIGDIITIEHNETVNGPTNSHIARIKYSGTVTAITSTTIQFIPSSSVVSSIGPVALTVAAAAQFQLNIYRGGFWSEASSSLSQVQDFEWTPSLPIFDSQRAIPCAGTKQEFTLTPFSEGQWQKNIIESRGADKLLTTEFTVSVLDMRFYILTCDSNNIPADWTMLLDMNEIQCQSSPITSINQQQSMDVISSTYGISMAFQDRAATTNTLYPMTKFTIRDNLEQQLQRYYIRYEYQVPTPDFEGALSISTQTDTLTDLYSRTKIYDGSEYRELPETIEEYKSRGMYVFHPFPKTASSRNTRVYVQVNFGTLTDSTATEQEPFLLLFSHSKKVVELTIKNGTIVQVLPIDS